MGEVVYKAEPLRVQAQAAPPSRLLRGRLGLQLTLTSSPLNMGRSQAPVIAVRKTSNPEERVSCFKALSHLMLTAFRFAAFKWYASQDSRRVYR